MPNNPLITVGDNFTVDHKAKTVAEIFNEFSPCFGVLTKERFFETIGFIKDLKTLDDRYLKGGN